MEQKARILAKLECLRHVDQEYRVFGADGHRYRFHAPLDEEDVLRFERQHAIALPEEYRWFITHVGDGGSGPYYGLLPLEETVNTHLLERDSAYLSKPFPLREAFDYVAFFLECAEVETLDVWNQRTEEDPEYARRVDERVRQAFEKSPAWGGELGLCHYGCGIMFILVVVGPEAGTIWIDHMADDMGIFPLRNKHTGKDRVGFLDWYENWLDASLLQMEGQEKEARHLLFY